MIKQTILLMTIFSLTLFARNGKDIFSLCSPKDSTALLEFIQKNPRSMSIRNKYNKRTPLMAFLNRTDGNVAASILIKNGAPLDVTTPKGETALGFAIKYRKYEMIALLLESGASPDKRTSKKAPLQHALEKGNIKTMRMLINAGADLDKAKISPLYQMAVRGDLKSIKAECKPETYTNTDTTLILFACLSNNHKLVKFLLKNDVLWKNKEKVENLPLLIPVELNNIKILKLLLKHGAEPTDKPLYLAISNGQLKMVKRLVKYGAKLELTNKDQTSPIHLAAKHGQNKIITFLLKNGLDINLTTKNNATPLFVAFENERNNTAKFLIEKGADVTISKEQTGFYFSGAQVTPNYMLSPLQFAMFVTDDSTIKLLIDSGADINKGNEQSYAPLYAAVVLNKSTLVRMLSEYGVDPMVIASDTEKEHIYALAEKNEEVTPEMLKLLTELFPVSK